MSDLSNPSAVARVTEVIASSPSSFDEAIKAGLRRATETLENVEGAWVKGQKLVLQNGEIVAYRVVLKVTFVLK